MWFLSQHIKVICLSKSLLMEEEDLVCFLQPDWTMLKSFKLVAVTQRPSAISDEIRTQAENFFAFHMGNSDDIKALVKSNINYDGVISNFIQRETIAGNLYMVSSDQAFALPVRVTEFEKLVGEKVYPEAKFKD